MAMTRNGAVGVPVRTVLTLYVPSGLGGRRSMVWLKVGWWSRNGGCELLFGDGAVEDTLDD